MSRPRSHRSGSHPGAGSRSRHGGRHELGQNFLVHRPTIHHLADLVSRTEGTILEIGAGDGALTGPLARLGRPVVALELDEHRADRLRRRWPHLTVEEGDAMAHPLRSDVVVGNLPFHLTTPLLRRLLTVGAWRHAVLLTQWEVARKRAGVGGRTMLTAQTAPWFDFELSGRVPASAFRPRPSVDGGILQVTRRDQPLVAVRERKAYRRFVERVFNGRGGTMPRILQRASGARASMVQQGLARAQVNSRALPRDLTPQQWASIWHTLG